MMSNVGFDMISNVCSDMTANGGFNMTTNLDLHGTRKVDQFSGAQFLSETWKCGKTLITQPNVNSQKRVRIEK